MEEKQRQSVQYPSFDGAVQQEAPTDTSSASGASALQYVIWIGALLTAISIFYGTTAPPPRFMNWNGLEVCFTSEHYLHMDLPLQGWSLRPAGA